MCATTDGLAINLELHFLLERREAETLADNLDLLRKMRTHIRELNEQITAYKAKPRCSGHFHERATDQRLYVHHGMNRLNCPYPGHKTKPGARKGRRIYVNKKIHNDLKAAIRDQQTLEGLEETLRRKRTTERRLYQTLGLGEEVKEEPSRLNYGHYRPRYEV